MALAGIEWQISAQGAAIPKLLVQVQEFRTIKNAFTEFSQRTEPPAFVTGLLISANSDKRTFEMRLDSGEPLRGSFVEAISPQHTAELPKRYIAKIITTRKIIPATEKEEVSHFLEELVREMPI